MNAPHGPERFTLLLDVTIRPCVREDLPHLEWFGMFTAHREIFRRTFEKQEREEQLMLLAESGGTAVGQVWIDLVKRREESAGVLWALRVIPWLQGKGIGTRLLASAEQVLRDRRYQWVELGVEPCNPEARRLYERLGYEAVDEIIEECRYTPPGGSPVRVPVRQTLMRKPLKSLSPISAALREASSS